MRWFLSFTLILLVLGLGCWAVISDGVSGIPPRAQAAETDQAADTSEVLTLEEIKAELGERGFIQWQQEWDEATNPKKFAVRDRQIAEVADQTVESLCEALPASDHSTGSIYARASTAGLEHNTLPNGRLQAQVCLYDRRVCRMYDLLAAMPPDDAANTCRTLFDRCLQ